MLGERVGEIGGTVDRGVETFQARNFGPLEAAMPTPLYSPGMFQPNAPAASNPPLKGPVMPRPAPEPPTYGSLDYFMRVSHSVSRQDLYPDVLSALRGQINCTEHSKPVKKAK